MGFPGLSPEELENIELVAMPSQPVKDALKHRLDGSIAELNALFREGDATKKDTNLAVAKVGVYAVGLQEFSDLLDDSNTPRWQRIAEARILQFYKDNPESTYQLLGTPFVDPRQPVKRELTRLVFSGINDGDDQSSDTEMAIRIAVEDFEKVFELNPKYV